MVGMKPQIWVSFFCFAAVLTSMSGVAQSAKDAEKSLRVAVEHQQFILRGYSADAVTAWWWDGTKLAEKTPIGHELAIFAPSSVQWKGDHLKIVGIRHPLYLNKNGTPTGLATNDEEAITLDLTGAPALTASEIVHALFYSNLEEAEAGLPETLRRILPPSADPKTRWPVPDADSKQESATDPDCDCDHPEVAHCHVAKAGPHYNEVKPPKLIYAAEPEFSDQARSRKYNGNVQVYLDVSAQGQPENIWVVRGVGMGLDEKAVDSVRKYRFAPATCKGRPVKVDLYIEVNFQIF